MILKATKVDGVFNADPTIHRDATCFSELSYLEFLNMELEVMDATAVSLCKATALPIVVFNLRIPGNIKRIVTGERVGTIVR